jgi:hypothetical protein
VARPLAGPAEPSTGPRRRRTTPQPPSLVDGASFVVGARQHDRFPLHLWHLRWPQDASNNEFPVLDQLIVNGLNSFFGTV